MQSELVTVVLSILLIGVFAPAVRHKVTAWPRFLAALMAYRIVPESLAPVAGGVLVLAEGITLALLLVGPFTGLAGFGFVSAAALLLLYLLAMVINVARGRAYIDCGCGDEPTILGGGVLLRNAVLIGLATCGVFFASVQGITSVWVFVIGICLSLIGLALYQTIEQLLANRTVHHKLWLGLG